MTPYLPYLSHKNIPINIIHIFNLRGAHDFLKIDEILSLFPQLRHYQQSFNYSRNILEIFHLLLSFIGEALES